MEIIILDTDVVIEFMNGNLEVIQLLSELPNRFAITVITRAEIIQGSMNKLHQAKILNSIQHFITIDLNIDISQYFNSLFTKYYLSNRCSIPDMLNASVSICKGYSLFTLNKKDYQYIPSISLLDHHIKPRRGNQNI